MNTKSREELTYGEMPIGSYVYSLEFENIYKIIKHQNSLVKFLEPKYLKLDITITCVMSKDEVAFKTYCKDVLLNKSFTYLLDKYYL